MKMLKKRYMMNYKSMHSDHRGALSQMAAPLDSVASCARIELVQFVSNINDMLDHLDAGVYTYCGWEFIDILEANNTADG